MRSTILTEKINQLAPALVVLLVFFIPISVSVKSVLMVLTLLAIVFTPYYRHYLYYAFNTLWARAALVLFLYVILACFWSDAPFSGRFSTVDKFSKLIILPILTVVFIKQSTRQWVLNSYISAALLTCILSILKQIRNLFLIDAYDAGEVFYNHIVTGYIIAFGIYLAGLQIFKKGVSLPQRIFYSSMIFLGIYQIFFVNTGKTAYLIFAILMIMLILQRMSLKKAIMGVILFFCTVLVTYPLSPIMQGNVRALFNDIKLLQKHEENNSLGFRIQFHQYAESLFKEHPIIGIGTGGFPYRFSQEQPVPAWGKKLNDPHSQYWLILTEQGLIGIALFFFFLGTLFFTCFKLKETKPVLLAMLIAFCISSLVDTVFCYSPVGYLLTIFSALCFGELMEETSSFKESIYDKYIPNQTRSSAF